MRSLVSLAFLATVFTTAAVLAQSPRSQHATGPKIQLTLVAVDDETSAPIPTARFTLTDDTVPVGDLFEGVFDEIGTHVPVPHADGNGRSTVLVAPGSRMRVFARASGYPSGPTAEIRVGETPLTISVPMTQGVGIKGEVIDRDSRRPIEGVLVAADEVSFSRGTREVRSGNSTKTDRGGKFQMGELRPGAYVVETRVSDRESGRGYGIRLWPGGDAEKARPVNLKSGQSLDLGTIALQMAPLTTVSVRLTGDCEGHLYTVNLTRHPGDVTLATAAVSHVRCGNTAVMGGVLPGSYRIHPMPEDYQFWLPVRFGLTEAQVGKTNLTTEVQMRAPLPITGKVLERSPDPVSGAIREGPLHPDVVHLVPIGRGQRGLRPVTPEHEDVWSNPDGDFSTTVYSPPGGRFYVRLSNLPPNQYVDSLRYNGQAINGDEFIFDESAADQRLEIICSGEFGNIAGRVKGTNAGPVNVLLAPWPNSGTLYPERLREGISTDGTFRITKLRPGHYKAIAVNGRDRQTYEEPNRLIRALASGVAIDIVPGENALSLTNVRH
ncbi:MAG TPA: carboxypeptidase-like regulatory domain-containing protein [Bryobacteraceae bacterium]|nr:carboxypeptidase-like regulatory domain-containing protein [Bryobacteraceae bacterium]